ncbi:MAG: glycosyltransferase family 4 protein [Alphaproteobacteria bacterium]|nr:glycosyltransferase family 4 protein [Alphaproteobacteria bacterium]
MTDAVIHFAVPGSLDRRTGGTIYDRRMIEALRAAGREVVAHELPGPFPQSDSTGQAAAAQILRAADATAVVVIDGLALPAFEPGLGAMAGSRPRCVVLCHHPLALETGLDPAMQADLRRREGALFSQADRVIAPSDHTAHAVGGYGVAARRITVVRPGADIPPGGVAAARSEPKDPAWLLCVGNLIPRKGHRVLIDALARLPDLPWRLCCVGALDHDTETVRDVRAAVDRHGLGDRIRFMGSIEGTALNAPYREADLFVLPSFYEGYGMVFAEAMLRALPIVAAKGGAVPETVPATAGLLVPPGDAAAFADTLRRVLCDRALYRRLSEGAAAAARSLPSWSQAAQAFAAALDAA